MTNSAAARRTWTTSRCRTTPKPTTSTTAGAASRAVVAGHAWLQPSATGMPVVSSDICDWLAKEEADAEQWGGLGGARFYREQFAAARNEIMRLRAEVKELTSERDFYGRQWAAEGAEVERLRAAGDALAKWLWRGGGDLADMITAVAAWEEARRER